ncbi:MAG TPA: hypothetical protein VIR56_07375 [Solimonas sp.]
MVTDQRVGDVVFGGRKAAFFGADHDAGIDPMKNRELQELERVLGEAVPAGLSALDPASIKKLCGALQHARKAQRAQMAAATESSLQHVPFLLRGAVKKVLGIK